MASPSDEQLSLFSAVTDDLALARTVIRRSGYRAAFDFGVPLLVALVAAVSIVAELLEFSDPFALAMFAWRAAPRATTALSILALALILLLLRRLRERRMKMPFRFRLAGHVMKLGKILPRRPLIQGVLLRLVLRIHTGKKEAT